MGPIQVNVKELLVEKRLVEFRTVNHQFVVANEIDEGLGNISKCGFVCHHGVVDADRETLMGTSKNPHLPPETAPANATITR